MKKNFTYLSGIILTIILNIQDVSAGALASNKLDNIQDLYGNFPTTPGLGEPTTTEKILELAKNQTIWLITLPIVLLIGILLIIRRLRKK